MLPKISQRLKSFKEYKSAMEKAVLHMALVITSWYIKEFGHGLNLRMGRGGDHKKLE